jgi:predicted AlkP superfamily phosphohydrolase/phosphomutase
LIRECDWELCLAPYFEPHYAGHAYHRYLNPGQWGYDERRARRLDTALLDVYAAVDRGIASLIDAAGDGVNVLVFTGFGMRPNTNGLRVLDLVMEDLGYHARNAASSRARGLEAARRAALRTLPRSIGRAVKKRLPQGAVDRHLERLWLESTDWKRTRAYAESEPGHSFIRLAHPDRGDHDELCEEIADELGRLENAETGERAVDRVVRRDRIVFGPHAEKLPELSVIWNEKNMLLRVRHPRFGVVEEDLSELQPSEHVERGFLVASGPAVEARPEPIQGHVVDLAPTMLHLLGSRIPEEMDGRPLPLAPGLEPPARAAIDMDDDPWRER